MTNGSGHVSQTRRTKARFASEMPNPGPDCGNCLSRVQSLVERIGAEGAVAEFAGRVPASIPVSLQ